MTEEITKTKPEDPATFYTARPEQSGDVSYSKKETDELMKEAKEKLIEAIKRIEKIDWTLFAVVLVLLVMVVTLLIDSFHINSVTYKEYSEKTASVETTQKANEVLLKQIQEISEQNREQLEIINQLLKK